MLTPVAPPDPSAGTRPAEPSGLPLRPPATASAGAPEATDGTDPTPATEDAPAAQAPATASADPALTPPAPPRPPGAVSSGANLQTQLITIVIQLQPADGDPAGRPVLLSVRAGQGAPLFAAPLRYSALGALPGPITTLLQHLQLRALEQKRKTVVPPPARPAAPAASAPTPAAPPPASPTASPPAPAPPTDPASTQLTLF